MIYFERPEFFDPQFEAVSCYLVNDGEILLLQRNEGKPQANKWGTPAGKIEEGETPKNAVLREVFEETGIRLTPDKIEELSSAYVKFPEYDFLWHMFRSEVIDRNTRVKTDEHVRHQWVNPSRALEMDLVMDEDVCIKNAFRIEK